MERIRNVVGRRKHTIDISKWESNSTAGSSTPESTRATPIHLLGSSPDAARCRADCPLKQLSSQVFSHHIPLPESEEQLLSSEAIKRNSVLIYRPLSSRSTRLVELLPGNPQDPLECRLVEVDIIDKPGVGVPGTLHVIHYEALSYSWGSSKSRLFIRCNDVPYAVSPNLAVALHYLRSEKESRSLWCDALCINQWDNEERAQQVQNMLRIFEKADRVVAWIGTPAEKTSSLFTALTRFSAGPSFSPFYVRDHDKHCYRIAKELCIALKEHLQRPWFQRTWVRQEVFAAREMVILCGSDVIDFNLFIEQALIWAREGWQWQRDQDIEAAQNEGRWITMPRTIEVLQREFQHAGVDRPHYRISSGKQRHTAHWLRVLTDGGLFQVTDAKDRIYGTLGVLRSPTTRVYVESQPENQVAEAGYVISYDKSISEVYQYVVKFLINTSRTLDILGVFEDRRKRSDALPSWSIDWTRQTDRASLARNSEGPQNTSDDPGIPDEQDYGVLDKLELRGVRVGDPIDCLRTYAKGFKVENIFPSLLNMDQEYQKIIRSDCYIPGEFHMNGLRGKLLVPRTAAIDDIVVALEGCYCLLLLRPNSYSQLPEYYRLVGAVAVVLTGDFTSPRKIVTTANSLSQLETFVLR
jgi:hypothetical protein